MSNHVLATAQEVPGFTMADLDAEQAAVLPDRELMAKVKAKKLNVAGLISLKKLTTKL